jgi:hypothetical protein
MNNEDKSVEIRHCVRCGKDTAWTPSNYTLILFFTEDPSPPFRTSMSETVGYERCHECGMIILFDYYRSGPDDTVSD